MTNASAARAGRSEALQRLEEFVPQVGASYREAREVDHGSLQGSGVSRLSAYLRYRLLAESEVAEAVLSRHRVSEAQGFLGELLSRTYWKGWLEGRPQVYLAYRRALADDLRRFGPTTGYRNALEGRTGISAFDSWNQQLLETGYLHHQARLAYASIWIFTLRLPWTLGAAHFQHHLLDGDPATNTLSWRWVGGLHNPGKHHLARAADIAKRFAGRFDVKGRLNESAVSLSGPPLPPAHLLKWPQAPSQLLADRYALLVTPDDLSLELTPVGSLRPQLILLAGLDSVAENYQFSDRVQQFISTALADTRSRLETSFGCPVQELPCGGAVGPTVGKLLIEQEIPHLVYLQPTVGPWQELVANLTSRDVGLRYFPLRRSWDAQLFPLAEGSLYQFQKSAMPLLLKNKGKM
jgi:deoxyribodipyrimidine photo-lyase